MKLWVITCSLLALGACKKSDAPAAAAGSGSAPTEPVTVAAAQPSAFVAKMTELTDRYCACTDIDCATRVNDELVKWTVEHAGADPGSAADKAKNDELQKRFVDCTSRLQAGAPPKPEPKNVPPPARTAACEELHKKISAYASCDKITNDQRSAMFAATGPVEQANDDAKCAAQAATLVGDAKKIACDIAAVGVKKAGPPTPKCGELAKRLAVLTACDKLPFGWPEMLRQEAAKATDPNDDAACAKEIASIEGDVKDRFASCKF